MESGKRFLYYNFAITVKRMGIQAFIKRKKKKYFVYEYLFEENCALNVKRFDAWSEEWLEFIKENRSKGGLQHDYDGCDIAK